MYDPWFATAPKRTLRNDVNFRYFTHCSECEQLERVRVVTYNANTRRYRYVCRKCDDE